MPVRRTTAPDRLGGGFWRLFTADTVSSAGTVVSTLAIQFLFIDTLQADEQAIGMVRAAQWAPYLVFGLTPASSPSGCGAGRCSSGRTSWEWSSSAASAGSP